MARVLLAVFLLVFGLNLLLGLGVPVRITGLLALIAGVTTLMDHFRIRVDRK